MGIIYISGECLNLGYNDFCCIGFILLQERITELTATIASLEAQIKAQADDTTKTLDQKMHTVLKEAAEKHAEMKQKFVAKLKEIQANNDRKYSDLCETAKADKDVFNEALRTRDDTIGTLENRVGTLQSDCDEKGTYIVDLNTSINELNNGSDVRLGELKEQMSGKDQRIEELSTMVEKVKCECSERTRELDELRDTYQSCKTALEGLEQHKVNIERQLQQQSGAEGELLSVQQEIVSKTSEIEVFKRTVNDIEHRIECQREKFEQEMKEKSEAAEQDENEIKKKAEQKLAQIKKELEDEKQSVESKLNDHISEIGERKTVLEKQLGDLTQEAELMKIECERLKDNHRMEIEHIQQRVEQNGRSVESHTEDEENQQSELAKENYTLNTQINSLTATVDKLKRQMKDLRNECDVDMKTQRLELDAELERVLKEAKEHSEDQGNDHGVKIKQLVKEFNLKFAVKEREFQETFSNALGESINYLKRNCM